MTFKQLTAITTAQLVLIMLLAAQSQSAVMSPASGLILGLDGTDVTLASGKVASWNDQSAQGNDATQATADDQPVLGSVLTPSGQPTVAFAGSEFLDTGADSAFDSGQYTWYVVMHTNTASGNGRLINTAYADIDPNSGVDDNYAAWSSFIGSSNRHRVGGRDAAGGFVSVNSDADAYDTNQFFIFGGTIDTLSAMGDATNIVIDEANSRLEASGTGFTMGPSGHLFTRIGAGSSTSSASPTTFFEGEIAEVLVYDRILSSNEQSAVESYLYTKHLVPEPSSVVLLLGMYLAIGRTRRLFL